MKNIILTMNPWKFYLKEPLKAPPEKKNNLAYPLLSSNMAYMIFKVF